jgi:hypothetical protein
VIALRAREACGIALIAGCCARQSTPAPVARPDLTRIELAHPQDDARVASTPVAEAAPETVELDGLECPRGAIDLPGQAPPNHALADDLSGRTWCWHSSDVDVELTLATDGSLREVRYASPTASTSGGASAATGCWALAGDRLFIRRGTRWWDGWKAAVGGNVLDWRGRGWLACAPRA